MKVDITIDPAYQETKVVIYTDQMTDEIGLLIKKLSDESPQVLTGSREHVLEVLQPDDIYRVCTAGGKVFAVTTRGEFTMRQRLYELEERLDPRQFVRISNSEILNIRKASSFDMSLSGTILVTLTDGSSTYVSRRYLPKIRKVLGV